ncbi:MAG: hypothetical protein ACOY3K_06895 [Candidatus Omnitrophota bacterium]
MAKYEKTCSWIALFLAFVLTTGGNYASLKDLDLPKNFLPQGIQRYSVTSVKASASNPGFLRFQITAPHGEYTEEGLADLRKAVKEIQALEMLKDSEAEGGFGEGAVESIKDTGTGIKNLVTRPKESAAGIGSATKKLGSRIGRMFEEKEEGEKMSFGERMTGSTKRDLAKKMGVDVYSRNPYLQTKLDGMAKAQMGGKGAVMVAKLLIPVAALVSLTLTAGSLNTAADEFVDSANRRDIFAANKQALLAIGISPVTVDGILNHPYYTPREVTYFRFYLEKLKAVRGKEGILRIAAGAQGGLAAYKILHEAEIIAESFKGGPAQAEILVTPEGIGLKQGKTLSFATAYDVLTSGDLSDKVMARVREIMKAQGCDSAEILNAGKVESGVTMAGVLYNIKVREFVLFK